MGNLKDYKFSFYIILFFTISIGQIKAQNLGIGTDTPSEELHVVGDARIEGLSGSGNKVVGADNNGVLQPITPGATGEVVTQTATGPAFLKALSLNSTSLGADIQISSVAWANVPGMTITFTATQTEALLMFTSSGFAYTNSMANVLFRIRNGAITIGGTNTAMQSYDDVTGTTTPWSCSYTRHITGLIIGATYTYTLQGQINGILGTYNAAIFASSIPDSHHMTLSVIQ